MVLLDLIYCGAKPAVSASEAGVVSRLLKKGQNRGIAEANLQVGELRIRSERAFSASC